ncbi:transcriptional repressor [Streptomyces sp. DSM 42041]|uniref:Transcriptional repressor n=1 Tax=Streptomyces hazeniae TaxID=3075538 RepID=A0ABU2NZ72_9ACTN|nr:transcriptional repressor [Streptomyces sp. DSM 42041]MDT0382290.1 transcriptional repressor [Streptomyces sp. DSM 42041]
MVDSQQKSNARTPRHGVRMTHQRQMILEALESCEGFVSAQKLHARLQKDGSTVGLTTVYRALAGLERAGLADLLRDDTGERLYLRRPTDEHRHYLRCRDCGSASPLDADPVEQWAHRIAQTSGYTNLEHTLELTGVCAGCHDHGRSGTNPRQ